MKILEKDIRIQYLTGIEPDTYETMCYVTNDYWWKVIIEALETHYSMEAYRVIDEEANVLHPIKE